MRKAILIAAALAVAAVLGCPAAQAQDKKDITIGSTVYYMSEFITLMVEGMQAEADELGVKLTILDAGNDAPTQLNQVENLISSKVDVVLVAAVDADAIVPALDMAEAAKIPLTGVNMLMNTDKPYYYAGPNDVEAGELEAQYVVDALGGKGNVVILEGPIGTSAQLQRLEGNMKVLAKYPDIKILAQKPANWNREQALSTMENWLQTYPDQIDGVISHNDEMALGAIQAMEAKGIKLPVGSVDAIKDACQAIKEGRLDATVFQDAHLEGRLGVRVAYQVATGTPPPERINFIKMELITKDNVDKLLDTIYK
jgi:ribose transport system substrate-binding protein/inositol transport system substrate-binding protein